MDIQEITEHLRDAGCHIARSQVNQKGRFVHLIQPWDVDLFQDDVTDILYGRATLGEIVERNKGADLADPWPVA